MTIDFVRCPRLMYQMVGAKFEFTTPVPIQLFKDWLAQEAAAWLIVGESVRSHHRDGAFQQTRANYRHKETSSIQLGFRGAPEVTVRRHIPPKFEAYLRTSHDDRGSDWFVWQAHNLSDVGAMRDLLIKFDAAVREMMPQAKQVEAPFVQIKHPVTHDFIVNLDGERKGNNKLSHRSNHLWLPYGADRPVTLSARKIQVKRKWKKRLANMTPAGRAQVMALAR